MFENEKKMLDASKKLYENGVSRKRITPKIVIVESDEDFTIASSVLEDYDVELILEKPISRKVETEEVFDKATGFRDIFGIFRK